MLEPDAFSQDSAEVGKIEEMSMAKDRGTYLGKQGKIYGPFDDEEMKRLRDTGEIQSYAYVWKAENDAWEPLELPPPPPKAIGKQSGAVKALEALCYDSIRALVSGVLKNVSKNGCELVCKDEADSPSLAMRSLLKMNVLEPKTGKSVNMKVRVSESSRKDGCWIYHVRWVEP